MLKKAATPFCPPANRRQKGSANGEEQRRDEDIFDTLAHRLPQLREAYRKLFDPSTLAESYLLEIFVDLSSRDHNLQMISGGTVIRCSCQEEEVHCNSDSKSTAETENSTTNMSCT